MTGGTKQLEIALLKARQFRRAIWLMAITKLQFTQLEEQRGSQTSPSVTRLSSVFLIAIQYFFQGQR